MNLVLNVHVNANDLTPNTIDCIKQLQAMEQEGVQGIVNVTQRFSKNQKKSSEKIRKETAETLKKEVESTRLSSLPQETHENRNEPQNLPEDTDIGESFTLEEVQKALVALARAKGKEASKEVVRSFGAESATMLQPEVYPGVMKAIKKVMGNA